MTFFPLSDLGMKYQSKTKTLFMISFYFGSELTSPRNNLNFFKSWIWEESPHNVTLLTVDPCWNDPLPSHLTFNFSSVLTSTPQNHKYSSEKVRTEQNVPALQKSPRCRGPGLRSVPTKTKTTAHIHTLSLSWLTNRHMIKKQTCGLWQCECVCDVFDLLSFNTDLPVSCGLITSWSISPTDAQNLTTLLCLIVSVTERVTGPVVLMK